MITGPLFAVEHGKHDGKPRCAHCGEEIVKRRGRKAKVRAERYKPTGTTYTTEFGDVFGDIERPVVAREDFCNAACRDAWVKKHGKTKRKAPRKTPDFIKNRDKAGQLSIVPLLPVAEKIDRKNRSTMREVEEGTDKIDRETEGRFCFLKGSIK